MLLKRCPSEGTVHNHPANLRGNKEWLVAQTTHTGSNSGVRWYRSSPSGSWSLSNMPAGPTGWDQGGARFPSSFGFSLQSQS